MKSVLELAYSVNPPPPRLVVAFESFISNVGSPTSAGAGNSIQYFTLGVIGQALR